jgi:hypothetical protein
MRPPVWSDAQMLCRIALTLAIGSAGGTAFALLGLPAGWLTGAAILVGAAALMNLPVGIPLGMRNIAFAVLGASIGASVTPETLALMWRWPIGLVGLAGSLLVTMLGIALYLEKVHGFDRATAKLSSIPGNMSMVLALTEQTNCDRRRVIIVQIFRLVMMVIVAPMLLALAGHGPPPNPRASNLEVATPLELLILLAAAAVGIVLLSRVKFPAPFMFGAMLGGAVLYGSGLQWHVLPSWLLVPCFVITGTLVGTNLVGMDRNMLLHTSAAGLGSVAIGTLISLACAWPIGWIGGLPVVQVWFAYAPGGVDMMAIMALALGLDAAFVAAHHAARFFCLGLMVPWLTRDVVAEKTRGGEAV